MNIDGCNWCRCGEELQTIEFRGLQRKLCPNCDRKHFPYIGGDE